MGNIFLDNNNDIPKIEVTNEKTFSINKNSNIAQKASVAARNSVDILDRHLSLDIAPMLKQGIREFTQTPDIIAKENKRNGQRPQ